MKNIITALLSILLFTSCHDIPEYGNNAKGNFEALWTILDEHYCFFDEKGVDWDEIHDRYAQRVHNNMGSQSLFELCSDMINELRDGHTNLSAPFASSFYRKWWSDYPQNYDARIIQQYYFNFNYRTLGAFDYGLLSENIGYIHYSSFESGIGAGNMDYILAYFLRAEALIIDVRDNGGGNLTNVEDIVNRFIDRRILAGYISHKTGPGHLPYRPDRRWPPLMGQTCRSPYQQKYIQCCKQFCVHNEITTQCDNHRQYHGGGQRHAV